MIDSMNSPSNIDHERDEDNVTDDDAASTEETEETTGGYYYDDKTGYEVFRDEDEGDEESARESSSRQWRSEV